MGATEIVGSRGAGGGRGIGARGTTGAGMGRGGGVGCVATADTDDGRVGAIGRLGGGVIRGAEAVGAGVVACAG